MGPRRAAAAARITGLVLLYLPRFALAAPETARGLRTPHAGLQAGTARTYLYAELNGRKP